MCYDLKATPSTLKYAAKYKKKVDAIANYIQREYKGGANIAKAIKLLSLPTLQGPGYPNKAKAGETDVNPGDVVYILQQDVAAVKKQIVQLEENKKQEAHIRAPHRSVLARP